MPHKNGNQGFTLIEVLIALSIFAIIAILAISGLVSVIKTYESLEQHATQLSQQQIALLLLERDLFQSVNRTIIMESGFQAPAFEGSLHRIEFTHMGYNNPNALLPRSTLQRVAYFQRDHELIRRTWPVLDRVNDTKPIDQVMLANIDEANFRFLNNQRHFSIVWANTDDKKTPELPTAVECTIIFLHAGKVMQLYLLPR